MSAKESSNDETEIDKAKKRHIFPEEKQHFNDELRLV